MKLHHLNCGSLNPRGGALLMPGGSRMSCHCLLVETARDGLVLVDAGLGDLDMADPAGRLGSWFKHIANPVGDPEETAARQVVRLGHAAAEVRHVVMTHLDLDHAGGLCDFPDAQVHVMQAELTAATRPETAMEARRYQPAHWEHRVAWVTYPTRGGQAWHELPGVRPLEGVAEDILLVPLPGHTRGHAGVAVKQPDGWLLHVGDALMSDKELTGFSCPALKLYHRAADVQPSLARKTRESLTSLAASPGIRVVTSHDYRGFEQISR